MLHPMRLVPEFELCTDASFQGCLIDFINPADIFEAQSGRKKNIMVHIVLAEIDFLPDNIAKFNCLTVRKLSCLHQLVVLEGRPLLGKFLNNAVSFTEISEEFHVPVADLQSALNVIRGMQPTGLGAYYIEDCLCMQLDNRKTSFG